MRKTIRWIPLLLAIALLLAWPDVSPRAVHASPLPGAPAAQTTLQHTIILTWNASTTSGATYNVYRATVSGGPYTKINTSAVTTTTYTDANGAAGTKYFYVVTAVDAGGFESPFSNEASATFLALPAAPTGLAAVSN